MTSTEDPPPPLHVEFDGDEACPIAFEGDPAVVLYFASWAFSLRFGAQHELALAARRIETAHKVALRPLLRYADRRVEDEADRRELQRIWQDPAPLADCCRAVAAATVAGDRQLDELIEGYEDLAPRLQELAAMCDWAASRGARVRLSFDLGDPGPPAAGV